MMMVWAAQGRSFIEWSDWCRYWLLPGQHPPQEQSDHSATAVKDRGVIRIKAFAQCINITRRRYSQVLWCAKGNCNHCQWYTTIHFLSFIASQKEKPLLSQICPCQTYRSSSRFAPEIVPIPMWKSIFIWRKENTSVVKIGFITSLWHAIFVLNDDDLEECFEALRNECGLWQMMRQ